MDGLIEWVDTGRQAGWTGLDLCKLAEAQEGVVTTSRSAGQVALADFLLTPDADSAPVIELSVGSLVRCIAGRVVPTPGVAAMIGRLTGGAVTWEMWQRPALVDEMPAREPRPPASEQAAGVACPPATPAAATTETVDVAVDGDRVSLLLAGVAVQMSRGMAELLSMRLPEQLARVPA